jgi:hypothetical protein
MTLALVKDVQSGKSWLDVLLNGTRPTFDNRVCLHGVCLDLFLKALEKPISVNSSSSLWTPRSDTDILMDGAQKCRIRSKCFLITYDDSCRSSVEFPFPRLCRRCTSHDNLDLPRQPKISLCATYQLREFIGNGQVSCRRRSGEECYRSAHVPSRRWKPRCCLSLTLLLCCLLII